MPVVPTYRAKQELDPGQAPQVRLSDADAQAQARTGAALQGLGSAIGGFADRITSIKDQQAKFDAGIQDDLRRADLTRALDEAKLKAPENGVGFHDSVLPKMDELAEKRFAAMPPGQAEQYRAKWQAERAGWSNELAKTERGIGGKYQVTEIDKAQQAAFQEINSNPDPAAVDAVRERVQDRINNASYLSTVEKAALTQRWGSTALATEAAQRFKSDPVGAARALGVPLSGGPLPADAPDAIKTVAQRLGIKASDLATVISYETGGTFSPGIRGGAGGRHIGLIQFGGAEQKQYGAHQRQTFGEQMEAVERYLKDRGLKPGMGLLDLYSTINAGRPGLYNASDAGNGGAPGSVRDKVEQQMGAHKQKAAALLGEKADDSTAKADTWTGDKRYAALDPDMRQKIVGMADKEAVQQARQEEQAVRAEVADLRVKINDDLASMEKTGKGLDPKDLPEDRVARVMGREGLEQWRADRDRRFKTYSALTGIDELPEAEIDRRLDTLQPQPGTPGFADDMQNYTRARQKADKIVEARRADPALAVENISAVKSARANVQYVGTGDAKRVAPESAQAVVAARLAAQNDLGIETPMAVTRSEARVIARQLRVIGNEDESRVEGFVKSLRSTYGDFADEVLASTLQHEGVNRQLSILATDMLNKVALGQSPSVSQARQAEVLTDDKKLSDALRTSRWGESPVVGDVARDVSGVGPASAPGPLPRSAFQTAPTFDARDIKGLVEGKVDPTDFDMKYGGQAPNGKSWSAYVTETAKKRLGGSGSGWQPGQPIKMSPELQSQAR